MTESLFDPTAIPEKPTAQERPGTVRIEKPERNQIELRIESLDDRIPWDHPVRTVWEFVERLDFEGVNSGFKSFAGGPGRSVKDRRILFALWLYESPGLTDPQVLAVSLKDDAVLVTADKDFGELIHRQHQSGRGVVLLRLGGVRGSEKAAIVEQAFASYADR